MVLHKMKENKKQVRDMKYRSTHCIICQCIFELNIKIKKTKNILNRESFFLSLKRK